MKKMYEVPDCFIESFALSDSIAAGCTSFVKLGPGDLSHEACADYPVIPDSNGTVVSTMGIPFYDLSCTCELTSSDGTLITS